MKGGNGHEYFLLRLFTEEKYVNCCQIIKEIVDYDDNSIKKQKLKINKLINIIIQSGNANRLDFAYTDQHTFELNQRLPGSVFTIFDIYNEKNKQAQLLVWVQILPQKGNTPTPNTNNNHEGFGFGNTTKPNTNNNLGGFGFGVGNTPNQNQRPAPDNNFNDMDLVMFEPKSHPKRN